MGTAGYRATIGRRRRRVGPLAAVLFASAGLLTACPPVGVPAGYIAPVIDSVTPSSSTVAAGTSITFTVRAHDDEAITAIATNVLIGPGGLRLPKLSTSCTPYVVQPDGPNAVVGTSTCDIPSYLNTGTWTYWVDVRDLPQLNSVVGVARFEVTGGSNDTTGPVVHSVSYSPAASVPNTGAPVYPTIRLSDDTLPLRYANPDSITVNLLNEDHQSMGCIQPTAVPVGPNTVDVTLECIGLGSRPLGTYTGTLVVSDAIGNQTAIPLSVTLT